MTNHQGIEGEKKFVQIIWFEMFNQVISKGQSIWSNELYKKNFNLLNLNVNITEKSFFSMGKIQFLPAEMNKKTKRRVNAVRFILASIETRGCWDKRNLNGYLFQHLVLFILWIFVWRVAFTLLNLISTRHMLNIQWKFFDFIWTFNYDIHSGSWLEFTNHNLNFSVS